MGVISRKLDTADVTRGWWDGGGKRAKTPVAARKNKSRGEHMYLLGYNAAIENKTWKQTMGVYRDHLRQEEEDAKSEAMIKAESSDASVEAVEAVEESDHAIEEQLNEEEQAAEGAGLSQEEETRVEEYDTQHDTMLVAEEEDEQEVLIQLDEEDEY